MEGRRHGFIERLVQLRGCGRIRSSSIFNSFMAVQDVVPACYCLSKLPLIKCAISLCTNILYSSIPRFQMVLDNGWQLAQEETSEYLLIMPIFDGGSQQCHNVECSGVQVCEEGVIMRRNAWPPSCLYDLFDIQFINPVDMQRHHLRREISIRFQEIRRFYQETDQSHIPFTVILSTTHLVSTLSICCFFPPLARRISLPRYRPYTAKPLRLRLASIAPLCPERAISLSTRQ